MQTTCQALPPPLPLKLTEVCQRREDKKIILFQNLFVLETRGIINTDLIGSLAERVRGVIVSGPSLPEITCAASLAHHGLLGSVSEVMLRDVDLSSVPTRHQASLASCVKTSVSIENVSGCDLVAILDSLNCQALRRLSVEETRTLVQAMESPCEEGEGWIFWRDGEDTETSVQR